MKIEMGESLMQSWLKHVKGCKITQLNWKCSETWKTYNKEEILELIEKIKFHYPNIFKQNKPKQLISQAELDVLGINTDINPNKFYAIDIAFHEFGLRYGSSNEEAIDRITKKLFRSALVLYSQFNLKFGEILFASPKINPAIYEPLQNRIDEINRFMKDLGFNFNFYLLANEKFYYEIFSQSCDISSKIADTSELFMRAYQLTELCKSFEYQNVDKCGKKRENARITKEQESQKQRLTKTQVIGILKENNVIISDTFTMASKNSTQDKYWANPNISYLGQDWWLILNDHLNKELHSFFIPKNSISPSEIKTKGSNNNLIDLQIYYNDNLFTDSRSRIEFSKWHFKTVAYEEIQQKVVKI